MAGTGTEVGGSDGATVDLTDRAAHQQGIPAERLGEFLGLLPGADTVELKLTVPEMDRRSAIHALGIDVLSAEVRQVMFFDTPDLDLNAAGLVVRARRVQRKPADSVVKLRPVVPSDIPAELRTSTNFGVEVDAMPGGFVCSASMKFEHADDVVRSVMTGGRPVKKAFTREQRQFFAAHAPEGLVLEDLRLLGPVNVMKLKFTPKQLGRRLVAEMWMYPDGTHLVELSTKCAPAEAFLVAAQTKSLLADAGVPLDGAQATKTKLALTFFASELARPPAPASV